MDSEVPGSPATGNKRTEAEQSLAGLEPIVICLRRRAAALYRRAPALVCRAMEQKRLEVCAVAQLWRAAAQEAVTRGGDLRNLSANALSSSPASKKTRGKVPKRVHKAEREKLKREQLNELFLELAEALELSEQNSGKASILCETTRVVKDMLVQIECLKKENATLLSESQYVAVEKNELEDENSALHNQIRDLKSTLNKRMRLDLNITPADSPEPQVESYFPKGCLKFPFTDPSLQQASIMNPFFATPLCSDPEPPVRASRPMSNVSKPQPRYPTPSDSWPFQILEKRPEVGKEFQYSGREQVFGNV